MGIYGLDPPYIYFNVGMVLVGLSGLVGLILVVFIILEIYKLIRKSNSQNT